MTYPLPHSTLAAFDSLLDLNLNMNLNPEMTVHDNVYNVKYGQPDTLHKLVLFEQNQAEKSKSCHD